MNIGANLSNFGLIVFNIDPEESIITIIPVIFLSVGKCTAINISFLLKQDFCA